MSDHDAFYSIFSRIANHTDNTHKNQYVCQNILLCHSYHEYREATCVKNIIIAESSSSSSNTHQEFGEHRHRTSNQNPISGDLELVKPTPSLLLQKSHAHKKKTGHTTRIKKKNLQYY